MKTGVRWWIRFCVKIGTEPLLYTEADLPLSFEAKRSVEGKLLLFMMWMARHKHGKQGQEKKFLAGSTLRGYANHVQMWAQVLARGVPYAEAVGMKGRLKMLQRAFMRERPSKARAKVPFTGKMFAMLQRAVMDLMRGSRSDKQKFEAQRLEMMVAAALEGLLRTSEMAAGVAASAANKCPFKLAQMQWCYRIGSEEYECEWEEDGTIDTSLAEYMRMPMGPHKADQLGERDDELLYPRSDVQGLSGTFEITRDFLNKYPVPRSLHHRVAWFRKSRVIGPDSSEEAVGLISHNSFWSGFKAVCKTAKIEYGVLGKHCFRVGGMNALQEANASVCEIMALGRWRSDAWKAYARRNRRMLMRWTGEVLRQRQQ